MKLLHVCESVIGGTGSYISELIPRQVELYGADNVVLLIPGNQMHYLDAEVVASGVKMIPFSRKSRFSGIFSFVSTYARVLREFKPDVVHAHSSIAGLVVRLSGVRRKYTIVFCPHGWSVDIKGARVLRCIAECVERVLALNTDRVVLISQHEYRRAGDLGFPEKKLSLVISGIVPDLPQVAAAKWDDTRLKVLFAGRFDFQKGVDVLLQAVEGQEARMSLRLVGGGVVNSLNLPESLPLHVANLGWLDRLDVCAQMKSCDVLVVPSRWEGFGLVAIEAMRLGVPVVASAVGGLREILGEGQYGVIVPPEDPAALRAALLALTPARLKELSELGRTRFLAAYSSERMVREIDAVYAAVQK
ncbi:glycosyltransferase [Xanthobacter oligotrophicus]|uniref:glycosyltransferase n=1 Tax=Xanthobacter oligotrophicus TaxID=2607286 RepID=UPI0011F0D8D0|nr:glycosyltransferase [Xanthobacter oligotrophicus]MCG5237490.1 glycosyltransferase [Xanthobacter oligotrophicus]